MLKNTYGYDLDYVLVKFYHSPFVTSLSDSNFVLEDTSVNPALKVPLSAINVVNDYDSLSRILTLYPVSLLTAGKTYRLTVSGIYGAYGAFDTEVFDFSTEGLVGKSPLPHPFPPIYEVVSEDRAAEIEIIPDNFTSLLPVFSVTDISPSIKTVYVDPDYHYGRIVIKFSKAPSGQYLSNKYFKVSKRAVEMGYTRWQEITNTKISIDGSRPWVYIDMPSTDAVPVYGEANSTYFENNTKYKVFVSKYVTS